jgi:hypothetical protein
MYQSACTRTFDSGEKAVFCRRGYARYHEIRNSATDEHLNRNRVGVQERIAALEALEVFNLVVADEATQDFVVDLKPRVLSQKHFVVDCEVEAIFVLSRRLLVHPYEN